MESWHGYIEGIQARMMHHNLLHLLAVVLQAGTNTGELAGFPKIEICFSPLWSASELEQARADNTRAAAQQAKAETAQTYVDMGVLTPFEVRRGLAATQNCDIAKLLDDKEKKNGNW